MSTMTFNDPDLQEKWDAFYNDSNETMIGYSPAEKQLVLFQDVTNGDDVMVYDMITTSWVDGGGRTENKEKTEISEELAGKHNVNTVYHNSGFSIIE